MRKNDFLKEFEDNQKQCSDDHEAWMAKSDLHKIAEYAAKLEHMIDGNDELDGWVQAKITIAAEYIGKIYHYLDYHKNHGKMAQPRVGDSVGFEIGDEVYEAEIIAIKEDNKIVVDFGSITESFYSSFNALQEAYYQGRDVDLNDPMRNSGSGGKFKVFVNSGKKDKQGRIKAKKVTFGDKNMEIKRDDPDARRSFRARHKCDQKKDKKKAGYWSCKFWQSGKSVSDLLK